MRALAWEQVAVVESKSQPASRVLRFGVFQVNIAARELRKHGVRVRLPGQPFHILSVLLEKPGEIVSREEMRQRLWASDTFVDFEHSLNSAIKKLRAALGDGPDNSRYVETIPRLGYRFIAPVEEIVLSREPEAETTLATGGANSSAAAEVPPAGWRGPAWMRWRVSFGISAIVVLVTASYFLWSHWRPQPRPQTKVKTDASIMVSHDSAKPTSHPPSAAGTAESHELYLKGIYFWNKRTVYGFHQAIECFQQATIKDPNNAQAYAGLANSYTLLTAYTSASENLYVPQARASALRALEIDQNSAEAHTAMALILQNHDWDWHNSEKEYRRAIELDPDYATAHQWYAEHLMWLGHFKEALSESEKARQLDPLSLIIAADYGAILFYSRQHDSAIEQFRSVLQKDPDFYRADLITLAYVEKGMYAQALTQTETLRRVYGEGPWYWSKRVYIYGRAGQQELAQREMLKLENLSRHEQADPVTMMWAHLGLGKKDEALADLEAAYAGHLSILATIMVDPSFDPLRRDPRFQDLLRRVHLAE
jgi:DNA-binding winged helix-turn-helix (wHTH) protein/Tfp pilus assembly protein PilF